MKNRQSTEKYTAFGLMCLLSAALAPTTGNALATAPSQLFGKSLTLVWQTSRVEKNLVTGQIQRYAASATLRVYISSKGRLFTEKTWLGPSLGRQNVGRSFEVSDSPDRKEVKEWRVEGTSLVAYHEFNSGMRRMIVDFDKEYQTCSLKVSFAKRNGSENIIRQDGIREIQSIEVSNPTCRIQAGNIFE
jgi:hypothetical protein